MLHLFTSDATILQIEAQAIVFLQTTSILFLHSTTKICYSQMQKFSIAAFEVVLNAAPNMSLTRTPHMDKLKRNTLNTPAQSSKYGRTLERKTDKDRKLLELERA